MFDIQLFLQPQLSFRREYIQLFLWPQRLPHRKQSTLRRPAMAGSHKCKQVLVESRGVQIPCGWSPGRINCTLTLKHIQHNYCSVLLHIKYVYQLTCPEHTVRGLEVTPQLWFLGTELASCHTF